MTDQETFDKVVKHLFTQGRRSTAPDNGACMYRSADGLKCAIGVLIPDEKYDPSFEGMPITRLGWLPNFEVPIRNLGLLDSLQRVHDEPQSWNERGPTDYMVSKLKGIAEDFKLEYN